MSSSLLATSLRRRVAAIVWFGIVVLLLLAAPTRAQAQPLSNDLGPNLGTFALGQVEIPLVASGGTGAYSWSIVAGAPPPGLVVRTDGPSWFPSNAAAGLIGVATTPGTYGFTLRVSDGSTIADRAVT